MAATKNERSKRRKVLKNRGLQKEDVEESARLHGLLFGKLEEEELELDENSRTQDFRHDVLGALDIAQPNSGVIVKFEEEACGVVKQRKPAWEDEEEQEITVSLPASGPLKNIRKVKDEDAVVGTEYVARLRAQHAKLNPGTDWALLASEKKRERNIFDSDSELDEENDEILRQNDDLIVKSRTRLPEHLIDVTRMRDANAEEPSNAVIQSVQFHRNAQILMTAGMDKKLRFFQIDGKRNPKVQSIFLEDFPIRKAAFTPDGSKVIATARRKVYAVYDLLQGKVEMIIPLIGRQDQNLEMFEISTDNKIVAFIGDEGYILLSSLGSKQLVGTLKMNGSAQAVSFSSDGNEMMSTGGDGEIYCWDLRMRRCIYKCRDDGCIKGSAIAISSKNTYFATGSNSGVVNIYERDDFLGGVSKPRKSLMNLTTTIDVVKFNSDSQLLAICSRMTKNALRLVHLPSFTVFSNWPTSHTPLHYVHSLDFSPGGGYLATGNAAGKVLLYRLRHYQHA